MYPFKNFIFKYVSPLIQITDSIKDMDIYKFFYFRISSHLIYWSYNYWPGLDEYIHIREHKLFISIIVLHFGLDFLSQVYT